MEKLKQLFEEFLSEDDTRGMCVKPSFAWGKCQDMSEDFAFFLQQKEIESEIWCLSGEPNFPKESRISWEVFGDDPYRDHVVVKAEGVFIDCTMRQFDPDSPFPFIFESYEGVGWTNAELQAVLKVKNASRRI